MTPIAARLNVIANSVKALTELGDLSPEEFADDNFAVSAAERNFQVAIQAALDIGNILLSEIGAPMPHDYGDIFPALAKVEVLPTEFAQRLVNMAKLRNILVHMYLAVDPLRLHNYIQNDLDDFALFAQYISEFIAKTGGDPYG